LLIWSAASTAAAVPASAQRMTRVLLGVPVVCWVFAMCIRLYSPERFSLSPISAI
jgi:hypothetical protein